MAQTDYNARKMRRSKNKKIPLPTAEKYLQKMQKQNNNWINNVKALAKDIIHNRTSGDSTFLDIIMAQFSKTIHPGSIDSVKARFKHKHKYYSKKEINNMKRRQRDPRWTSKRIQNSNHEFAKFMFVMQQIGLLEF